NLYQFGRMIWNRTGKLPILSYGSYGCYCGWGGQGPPKDATDRCCLVHDCCYTRVGDCSPKMTLYSYRFENGDIICDNKDPCKRAVCECDREAAICLGENVNTYDKKYKSYEDCTEEVQEC
nr:Chain A, phospholipase A2 [Echis carinatus]